MESIKRGERNVEFPYTRVRDLFALAVGGWITEKNALFDVTLHLPYIGRMCFRYIDDVEGDLILVSGVQIVERGNLPAKWRSSIASKNQNNRLRSSKRRKCYVTGMVKERKGEIGSGISDMKCPCRAFFHMVSNGNSMNGTGPTCIITRENVSGGRRMAYAKAAIEAR